MGQIEVLKVIEKSKQPLSSKQIAEALNTESTKICPLLLKLLKSKDIKFIELNTFEAKKKFNYISTRRLRFYYV